MIVRPHKTHMLSCSRTNKDKYTIFNPSYCRGSDTENGTCRGFLTFSIKHSCNVFSPDIFHLSKEMLYILIFLLCIKAAIFYSS